MGDWDIRVPSSTAWSSVSAVAFLRALMTLVPNHDVEFFIEADSIDIRYAIWYPDEARVGDGQFFSLVQAHYPHSQIVPWEAGARDYPLHTAFSVQRKVGTPYFEWITPVQTIGGFDQLAALTQPMNILEPGEYLTYTVRTSKSTITPSQVEDHLTVSAYDAGWRAGSGYMPRDPYAAAGALMGRFLGNSGLKRKRVLRFSEGDTERYLQKLTDPAQRWVTVAVQLVTPSPQRLMLLSSVSAAVSSLVPPVSRMRLMSAPVVQEVIRTEADRQRTGWRPYFDGHEGDARTAMIMLLTPNELGTLWHLPNNQYAGQKIRWA